MSDELVGFALRTASWIATYLIHSTCLLSGVWLILRLRATSGPAVREGLWKVALVGSLITTPLQMLMARPGFIGEWTIVLERIALPQVTGESQSVPDANVDAHNAMNRPAAYANSKSPSSGPTEIWVFTELDPADHGSEGSQALAQAATPQLARHPAPSIPVAKPEGVLSPRFGGTGWLLAGVGIASVGTITLIGLFRSFWQTVRFRKRVAECRPLEQGIARDLLDELCLVVPRSPKVRLLCSPSDPEPAAFGVWRWTIVLPERAERDLPHDELRSLLAHELAHLVRGDVAWLCVGRIICSCFAFQPLNFLARREWQRAAELLCDTWAVSRTGSRLALARCLTEVAGWRLDVRACAASLAATGRKSGLADRIERLVGDDTLADGWTAAFLRRRLVLVTCMIGALLIFCGPRVSLSAKEPAEHTIEKSSDAKPSEPVSGSAEAAEISEVIPEFIEIRSATVSTEDPKPVAVTQPVFALPESNISTALKAVDEQLNLVEEELAVVETLLQERGLGDEGERLLEKLRKETARLKAHRIEIAGARNGTSVRRSVVKRQTVTEEIKETGSRVRK